MAAVDPADGRGPGWPARACRGRGRARAGGHDRGDRARRRHRGECGRPGRDGRAGREHHGTAGLSRAAGGRRGHLRGQHALARGLRDAHGRGPGRDADRPVPAGPERRITERPLADGELMGPGPVPGAGFGPAVPDPRAGRYRAGGYGGTSPARVAGLFGPGGRPGRDRPAGAQRGAGAQRRPAGRRRHPARAHGPRGTSAHRPRTARRGGAPHIDDRRPGGDGPAGHPGHARRRCAAAAADR